MVQANPRCLRGARAMHEPVFMLAPARSYSTVTLALLAGHPDVYGFPEMLLFTADTVADLLDDEPPRARDWAMHMPARARARVIEARRSGLLRAVADLLEGSQATQAILRAQMWLTERSSWSPTRLMDHLLTLAYPRVGLEKSPETVLTVHGLDACMQNYPNARYIHLTRHPVTTQRSMQNHWRSCYPNEKTLIVAAASAWYLGHSRIVRKLAGLPAQQWIRVRAEDLLSEPQLWLPVLLGWLGLASDEDLISRMTHTENWRFAGTGPSGDLFGGDPGFMRSPALRSVPEPDQVSFDPSWGLPGEVCDRMGALARYLGY